MKKVIPVLLSLILILFTSCDLFIDNDIRPELYIMSMGVAYDGMNATHLANTQNDEREFREKMTELADQTNMIWHTFSMTDTYTHYIGDPNDHSDRYFHCKVEFRLASSLDREGRVVDKFGYNCTKTTDELTNETVVELFRNAFNGSLPKNNDLVIFYYAGHGADHTGNLLFSPTMAPYPDHVHENPDAFLTVNNILSPSGIFANCTNTRKLVILDSCHSGFFIKESDNGAISGGIGGRPDIGGGSFPYPEPEYRPDPPWGGSFPGISSCSRDPDISPYEAALCYTGEFNASNDLIPNIFILAAASSSQDAQDKAYTGADHSPFTLGLIDAMTTHDGYLMLSDLYREALHNCSLQTPQIIMNRYEMLLFRFR